MSRFITIAFAGLLASSAHAVVFTGSTPGPDAGPPAHERMIADFEGALPAGVTLGGTGYDLYTGSTWGVAAAPMADESRYLAVRAGGEARLSFAAARTVSVYAGSLDNYNHLGVRLAGGATTWFDGAALAIGVANGDQTSMGTNRRLFFSAAPGERITGLVFGSGGNSFEVDSIASAGVPEPATWATMIVGLGLVGAVARRRHAMPRQAHA